MLFHRKAFHECTAFLSRYRNIEIQILCFSAARAWVSTHTRTKGRARVRDHFCHAQLAHLRKRLCFRFETLSLHKWIIIQKKKNPRFQRNSAFQERRRKLKASVYMNCAWLSHVKDFHISCISAGTTQTLAKRIIWINGTNIQIISHIVHYSQCNCKMKRNQKDQYCY